MGRFVFTRLVFISTGRVRIIKKTLIQHIFLFYGGSKTFTFYIRLIENENEPLFPLVTIALAFGSTAGRGFTPLYGLYREVLPKKPVLFSRFGQE